MKRRSASAAAAVAAFVGAVGAEARLAPNVPPGPPPKNTLDPHPAQGSPPPAWVAVGSVHRWLGPSSFNWDGRYLGVSFHRYRPSFTLKPGSQVVFHLGFEPSRRLDLQLGSSTFYRLAKTKVSTWRVPRRGPIAASRNWYDVTLMAVGARGDALYVARFRVSG